MAPPSQPDKWPPPTAYDEIVTIIVGKRVVKTYSVHKGVLTFYSGYFSRALNGGFKEATSKEIKLPDAEPVVFDTVQIWLYSHQLHPANETDLAKTDLTEIAKVWVFGDAHDMPALQNQALNLIHDAVLDQWRVPTNSLKFVYQNTLQGSKLRLYCIDIIGNCGDAASQIQLTQDSLWPREALGDILRLVWRERHSRQSKETASKWDVCEYHVHEKDVKCVKKASG